MNHATLEVREDLMDAEIAFWEALGYEEEEPYSDKYGARWIWKETREPYGRSQLHLFPRPDPIIPVYGHVAVLLEPDETIGLALVAIADAYAGAPGFEWEEGTRYWGTRRVMARTPSGHRVELIEEHGPIPAAER